MATLAGVAANLDRLAATLADPRLPEAAAQAAVDPARAALHADLPSGRFTNLNGGTTLSVRADGVAVSFTPADAWGLLTGGAAGHAIHGRRRGRALRLTTGWVTGPVNHPGTRGRHTIGRARPRMETAARDAVVAAVHKVKV